RYYYSLFLVYLLTIPLYFFFFFMLGPQPSSTLFPYTTLFRSLLRFQRPALPRELAPLRVPSLARAGNSLDDESTDSARMLGHRRSEEHTSELQSRGHLVCRLLLEKKKNYLINGLGILYLLKCC